MKTDIINSEIEQCKHILAELEAMIEEKDTFKATYDSEKAELRARNRVLMSTLSKINQEYFHSTG